MDKKIAVLIAAVGSIAPMTVAQAAVTPDELDRAMNASSFAELLQSVPNAPAVLKADDEQRGATLLDRPDMRFQDLRRLLLVPVQRGEENRAVLLPVPPQFHQKIRLVNSDDHLVSHDQGPFMREPPRG